MSDAPPQSTMAAPQVEIKMEHRGAPKISPQSLVLVLFIVVLAYIFLAGDKGNKGDTNNENTTSAIPSTPEPSVDAEEKRPGRRYSRRLLRSHGSETEAGDESEATSAATLPNPHSDTESAPPTAGSTDTIPNPPRKPFNPLVQPPPKEEKWFDHPERLRPVDINAKSPGGIIKREGTPKKGKGINWVENSSGNVLSLPDNVVEGGMMDAGDNTELNPGWNGKMKETPHRTFHLDLESLSLKNVFREVKIPKSIMERLWQIEWMAQMESRGRIIGPQSVDGQVIGDPNQDSWDPVWGGLPTLGMEAASIISGMFDNEETIDAVKQCMEARQADRSGRDRSRNWGGFVDRTNPKNARGEASMAVTAERLCIGWFADTYRCVHYESRMCVNDKSVPMLEMIGPPARGLLWLEGIARHFWRQRTFSENGIDLHGLALRLAVPARASPKTNPKDPNEPDRYDYSLELHIFMWGGPIVQEIPDVRERFQRIEAGYKSLYSTRAELANILHGWGHSETITTLCKRRRIIFRPGYTLHGVNLSKSHNVNTTRAQSVAVNREPIVVVYPEDIWPSIAPLQHFFERSMCSIVQSVFPHEVSIFNMRQYQWNHVSLTEENNRLSDQHLLSIMWFLGPNLTGKSEVGSDMTPEIQTVRRIDFSAFIPMVKATHKGPDSERLVFFPLRPMSRAPHKWLPELSYISLSEIVLPFKKVDRSDVDGVNTVNILFDWAFGLRPEITSRPVRMGAKIVDHHLNVFITVRGKDGHAALSDQVTRYMLSQAEAYIQSQPRNTREQKNKGRREARAMARETYDVMLKRIKVVDGGKSSAMKAYLSGEPLQVMDPSEWPADFQDV